jgi:hypothetical protein
MGVGARRIEEGACSGKSRERVCRRSAGLHRWGSTRSRRCGSGCRPRRWHRTRSGPRRGLSPRTVVSRLVTHEGSSFKRVSISRKSGETQNLVGVTRFHVYRWSGWTHASDRHDLSLRAGGIAEFSVILHVERQGKFSRKSGETRMIGLRRPSPRVRHFPFQYLIPPGTCGKPLAVLLNRCPQPTKQAAKNA